VIALVSTRSLLPDHLLRHIEAQDRGDFSPWGNGLTTEAEASLRAAIGSTPADHPDQEALMSSRFMRKGAA
jgi:hypothetical protein